jgi:hypothetical protein
MTVVLTQGYRSTYGGQYYYEDTRPGHNIGYLSDGRMPVNSITFTPIFGPEPKDFYNTSAAVLSYWGSQYSPEFQTAGNGTACFGGWLRLGNKYCPTVTVLRTGSTTADTSDYFGNVLPYNWVSCVHDEQPLWMMVGDDDGADKAVHTQNNFYGLGQAYYSSYYAHTMNDGDELWSQLPTYAANNSASTGLGGGFMHSYKSSGSASYRGFHEISYYTGSGTYQEFRPYINFHRNGTSSVSRYSSFSSYRNLSYLGTFGGTPYYLETSLGQYEGSSAGNVHVSVNSYDVDSNTLTEEFNGDATATDASNSTYDDGGQPHHHASGVSDGYWKGPSKWMLASSGAYRWLMFPTFTGQDYPTHNMIKMDTGTNAVSYGGYTTSTSQPYMYFYNNDAAGWTDFQGSGMNPENLGGSQAINKQPGLAAVQFDWHGIYDANNGEMYGPDYTGAACSNGNGICNQLHSLFPAYGVDGRADGSSNARHRRIYTWQWKQEPNAWTSGFAQTQLYWRGFTTVPETPQNWVWLDEKRTLIAAICQNNTYIYECRGYDVHNQLDESLTTSRYVYYIGNTNTTGADAFNKTAIGSYNSAYTVPGFNGNPTASNGAGSFMGWVHVNTIPHRVVSMGIDKHGKIFALTANITALGGTNGYGGNLHMWTMNTPFSVALAGNVTTDTITYSGSNIDKTLTVEALGIRGRNVKSKVQLNIIGTDAQFDNGTQSKEVTTSTSGTVSETITVTGSSQFNIVASFGI